ncbi:Uncharacterized protein APZ42_025298 [Daphnia magna]|uniref:Uncharacterized protein n=1 Tax=Daphnia magna TaxID=35525 RepID=A0A164T8P9_9CRUS|nr:Uncharacterized protein APZ42_025298 [Daphnia magna]
MVYLETITDCWGVKVSHPPIVDAAQKMFHENHRNEYGYDQQLIKQTILADSQNQHGSPR